ncbi:MAG: FkbM family methyltransferase, partial [Bacteroidota bacterium]
MRKIFIDCGIREGDGIAAFLGDEEVGFGAYHACLKPRTDAHEFEFIGFESPDFAYLEQTRTRFAAQRFRLIEKLVWTFNGEVTFDSDGTSYDNRIYEVSMTEDRSPWRHPNPNARLKQIPCVDLAAFVRQHCSADDYLILKMDIEGAEYKVLQRLIASELLPWFNEMYIEYHW